VDDPVQAGARVLAFAREKANWPEVAAYLKTRVFPLADGNAKSSSGPFGK
jgi:hypothetical protein